MPWELHGLSSATGNQAIDIITSRDWRKHSYVLLLRRIVIKHAEQLELLLNLLETSLANSSSKLTVALGWWVTHIKFHSFQNIPPSHIIRLFACCPRIQVLIDATPYGLTSYDILVPSLPQNAPIKSLDWTFGGPDASYFLNSPSITNNLISLRCMTCQFPSNSLPHPPIYFSKLQYLELFL